MQTLCPACSPPTNWNSDVEYKDHLVSFHGTDSPDEALKIERLKKANSPKLPLGVPPEAAPTEEFTKTMQEIERAKASKVTPPPTPASVPQTPKVEPVILRYRYEGQHSCGNKVNTFELDADGKHFVICYCLICQVQIESREVASLNKKEVAVIPEQEPEDDHEKHVKAFAGVIEMVKKKGKNGGKRTK